MNKQLLFILLAGMWSSASGAAPVNTDFREDINQQASTFSRSHGADISRLLTESYHRDVSDCGSGQPAWMCSGVTLRGTSPKAGRFALDPSPASVESGGVSFSWLRKDAKFRKLSWNYLNGFFTFNRADLQTGIDNDLAYLCFYPEDGATNQRGDRGCGENPLFPKVSAPCQAQGIATTEQWLTHFRDQAKGNYHAQCGFSIAEQGQYDGASAFIQGLQANRQLHPNDVGQQNEIRIATWDTQRNDYPARFPVSAFFYIYDKNTVSPPSESVTPGINGARYDQHYYYQKTGIWVPVIRVTLPQTPSEDAQFEFKAADQRVPENISQIPIRAFSLLLN